MFSKLQRRCNDIKVKMVIFINFLKEKCTATYLITSVIYLLGLASIVYSFASYFELLLPIDFFKSSNYVVYKIYEPLHLFVLDNLFILAIILVTGFIWGFLLRKRFGSFTNILFSTKSSLKNWSLRRWKILILVIVLITFFINLYPRLANRGPVGSDTLRYIYFLNRIKILGPNSIILYSDRPFYLGFLWFIHNFFRISAEDIFRILPAVMASAYTFSFYLYAKSLFHNDIKNMRICIFISTFFAGISSISLRLFFDLHALVMALVMQNLLFVSILKYIRYNKKFHLCFSSLILALILLTHWVQFLLILLNLSIFSLLSLTFDAKNVAILRKIMLLALPAILILMLFMIFQIAFPITKTFCSSILLYIFPSLAPELVKQAINVTITGNPWGFFNPSMTYPIGYAHKVLLGITFYDYGCVFPSLLAILSFIFIFDLKHTGLRFLSTQVLTYSVMIILPGVAVLQKWRFALLFPIPILAGISFDALWKFLSRINLVINTSGIKRNYVIKVKWLAPILTAIVIVTSLQTAISWQNSIAINPYILDENQLEEINWIRNNFGVANPRLIVVVKDYNSAVNIASYVSPAAIYFGNLPYLLMNLSEPLDLVPDVPLYCFGLQSLQLINALNNSLTERYTVVLTEHTYKPSAIEKRFLKEIHKGIYIVPKLSNSDKINLFLSSHYLCSTKVSDDKIPTRSLNISSVTHAHLFINMESTECWQASNDGGGEAYLVLDNETVKEGQYSIRGVFKRVRRGFNIRLKYTSSAPIRIDDTDYITIFLRTDFIPINARIYIFDLDGNWRYWEISGVEMPNFAPKNGWEAYTWFRIAIPVVKNYTWQSTIPPDTNQIARVEIVFTPPGADQLNIWADRLLIANYIPVEFIKVEDPSLLNALDKKIPNVIGIRAPVSLVQVIILSMMFFTVYVIVLSRLKEKRQTIWLIDELKKMGFKLVDKREMNHFFVKT